MRTNKDTADLLTFTKKIIPENFVFFVQCLLGEIPNFSSFAFKTITKNTFKDLLQRFELH